MWTFAQCTRRREAPVARRVGRCRAKQRRTVIDVDCAACFGRACESRRRVVGAATGNDCAKDRTNVVCHTSNDRRSRRRNIAGHRHRCRRTRVARCVAGRHTDLRANGQRCRGRVGPCAGRIGRYRCVRCAVAVRVDLDRCACFGSARQRRAVRRVHRRSRRSSRIHRQIECRTRHTDVARRIRCRHRQTMCAFAEGRRRREAPVPRRVGRRCAQQRRAVVNTDRATCLCGTRERRRRIVGATTGNDCAKDRTNVIGHTSNSGRRRRRNITGHRHSCRRTRVARCVAGRHTDLRADRQRCRRRVGPCAARVGCDRCIRCAVAVRVDLDRRAGFSGARQRGPVRRVYGRRSRRRRVDRQIERGTRRAYVARRIRCRHRQTMCAFAQCTRRREAPVARCICRRCAQQRRAVVNTDRATRLCGTRERRRRVIRATTRNDCASD
ncbi:hypothetical protein FEP07_05753 [Burkholderia multivorans]|nr:hypothetical protein [Burkholderia multivorans]MDR9271025.1 hypothetical protein [Burkholderia multivorans]MDR9285699.1 hypothetical protein [Burkholderia multivorans]MDR9294190.1 hypothetical protein [Burkholderia multivorans]MDR9317068.1 hypothetical protein [Burkholderia multivorans]